MKKLLSLILAVALGVTALFCFASCAQDDTLTCGVTILPGMNEKDSEGNWTGFESEFATEVAKILGMKIEFQEITWEQKYNELNSGAIDCIWNGFTANCAEDDGTQRKDLVDLSYGYMLNQQCVVVKTANLSQYTSEASLAGKSVAVEGGSAGHTYAKTVGASQIRDEATNQISTFMEVDAGAVDFIVVDIILAQNLCGKGAYDDLSIVESIELDSEIYAIGFKKGSDLTAKVNAAIKQLEENGKLMQIAEKYGYQNIVKVQETID